MRITIIGMHYSPEVSGNAPYTTSLTEGLAATGNSVSVISGTPHYPEWEVYKEFRQWTKVEKQRNVTLTRLRHYVPRRPTLGRRLIMEISFGLRLVLRRMPKSDVTVLVTPTLFSAALFLMKRSVIRSKSPTVLWVQDLYSKGVRETTQSSSMVVRGISAIERWVASNCNHVIVIHEGFSRSLEAYGLSTGNISVVPNWVHLPSQPHTPDRASTRRRMGWEDKVVALHAGNMGVKQGLDTVISAAKLADTESAHVVFVLLGDGNQRSRLEGLSDGVHSVTFIDPVSTSEFQELMQAADTLIVCELEGVAEMSVPSKVTSYLTSGTPIVASVGNGLTRIELERSGGAICVDAGDPAALLGTIQALAADRERAGRLGEQGRSYAFHQLSGDSAIRIFEQTLRSAAATTE